MRLSRRTMSLLLGSLLLPKPATADEPVLVADLWQHPRGQPVAAREITIQAASTLCEGKGKTCHEAARLLDGNPATAWCEGERDEGKGVKLTLTLAHEVRLTGIELVPHYARSFRTAIDNGRPSLLRVEAGGRSFLGRLPDVAAIIERENRDRARSTSDGPCGDETCVSRDERTAGGETVALRFEPGQIVAAPVPTRSVTLTLAGVHPGRRFKDTCLAEVRLYAAP